jgi:predicted metalloprotease with PDZ domain
LINFTSTQSFVAGGELFKIENATNVVYGDHQAVVTDEINNISTYTLDDNGYAISCVRQEMEVKYALIIFRLSYQYRGKILPEKYTETLDGISLFFYQHRL